MRKINKSKKGITPVIAVILLLMMTVAIAGAAFFWFVRIQSGLQGGTESYQEQLSEKISANVEILDTEWDDTNDQLTIYLQNRGNIDIPLSRSAEPPTTVWILKDSNGNTLCSDDWGTSGSDTYCSTGCPGTLTVGELQSVVLSLTGDCDDIENFKNNTVFSYMVDFSGITATGARFIK